MNTLSSNSRWMSTFRLSSGVFSHVLKIMGISSEAFDIEIAIDIGPSQIFASNTSLSSLSIEPNVNIVMSFLFCKMALVRRGGIYLENGCLLFLQAFLLLSGRKGVLGNRVILGVQQFGTS